MPPQTYNLSAGMVPKPSANLSGGLVKKRPPVAAQPSSQQIIQQQTDIHPFTANISGHPLLSKFLTMYGQYYAGLGRAAEGVVTAPWQAVKAAFATPRTSEEAAAQAGGPMALALDRMIAEPAEQAGKTSSEARTAAISVRQLAKRIETASTNPAQLRQMQKRYPQMNLSDAEHAQRAAHRLTMTAIGLYMRSVGDAAGSIPFLGSMGQSAGARMAAGDVTGAVTESGANAVMMGAPEVLGGALKGGMGAAKKILFLGDSLRSQPHMVADLARKVEDQNEAIREANRTKEQEHLAATEDVLEEHVKAQAAADAENVRLAKEHGQASAVVDAENQAKLDKYKENNDRMAQEHEQAVQLTDAENQAKIDAHGAELQRVIAENSERQREYQEANAKVDELEKAARQRDTEKGKLARQAKQNGVRMVDRIRRVQAAWKDSSALQKTKGYKPTGILDRAYMQIQKATEGTTAPPDQLAVSVKNAEAKITGSTENLKIFRDILSKNPEADPEFVEVPKDTGSGSYRVSKGHPLYDVYREMGKEGSKPLTFRDLQGYYSELGRSLSKGNLPGDVYQSLRSLQNDIGGMMQNMADRRGVGSLLRRTQAQYRDYMQTFRESTGANHSGSPIADALNAKDPAYAVQPLLREETAARVRNSLARFDPAQSGGAAQLYDNLLRTNRAFETWKPIKVPERPAVPVENAVPDYPSLKSRPEATSVEYPRLLERPTLHQVKGPGPIEEAGINRPKEIPEKRIGENELRKAKEQNVRSVAKSLQRHIVWWAGVWPAFRVLGDLTTGKIPSAATFGMVPAAMGVTYAVGRLLENKGVVRFLGSATEKDIAAIPPELRGNFPNIIRAAKARGVQVSPALLRTFIVASAAGNRNRQ